MAATAMEVVSSYIPHLYLIPEIQGSDIEHLWVTVTLKSRTNS